MSANQADVWIVAGPPGAGKTTVAGILLKHLKPIPALLDKDTMYGSFVDSILAAENRPTGEREGDWYDKRIKIHEYAGMTKTAREIRSKGCPVLLSAPFTKQIHSKEIWNEWVERLGGGTVHLVWIKVDAETLHKHLIDRNDKRDTQKLAKFDDFITYMQPGTPPPFPHIMIDNRLNTQQSLDSQIVDAIR
ncbi:MAG TPA: AAA family ATPase [Candidatus Dormibacteraeota bacterium]|nr:AAA family ATPase [Candidatus Dormibacteraeota bacterium]